MGSINNIALSGKLQSSAEDKLLAVDWVQSLSARARDRVLADAYCKTYRPREYAARVGEISNTWIGVTEGLLKVSTVTAAGQAMMITAVPQNSWVGEGSVIKWEARRYDLMAMRETQVIHVPRPTFMWLLETDFFFSRYVIDHLNERAGQFLAMLEVSRLTDPSSRVAGAIANLFNPVLSPRAGPLLNISQEELGELAGLSRSTTNIALARLRELGLIRTEYGGILVLDPYALNAFAFPPSELSKTKSGKDK